MNVDKRHNSITDNKKTITRWLILAILAFNCSMAAMAQNIEINATTFPDDNFRNWVLSQSYGADGELTPTEISNVSSIDIRNQGITDITGIGFFTELTSLRLASGSLIEANQNNIPNVDLSALNNLQIFYGRNSGITHLTLPTNKTALRQVYLQDNPNLTGTLNFTGFTGLQTFSSENSNIERLIFDGCTSMNFGSSPFNNVNLNVNLKYIDISNCSTTSFYKGSIKLETFIAKNCTSLKNLTLNMSTVKYIDISGCTAFTSFSYKGANAKDNYNPLETFIARGCTNIKTLNIHNNSLTSVDVTGCTQLQNLNYPGNLLTYVDLSTNVNLEKVEASNNLFTDLGVDPAIHKKLQKIIANRAGYASYHKALTFPVLTQMQLNGGAYVRLDKSTGEYKEMNEQSGHVSMLISEIQNIENMPKIDKLLCRDNNLSVLNLHANTELTELELRHNRFLTLDLSKQTKVVGTTFNIDDQRSVEDLVVFDREKVAIYLPNALPTEHISRFSNLLIDGGRVSNDASIYTDGSNKKYLVITTSDLEKRDLDLYEKTITYDYDTKFWDPARKMMDVTVTGNTYIMYISPDSGAPTGAHTYYSGTIYLQYESIVPEGVTAYVLTGVKDMGEISIDADGNAYTTDQLNTLQYAAPGDVLPANTPVYVVSANPGFYAFKKNYKREYKGWKYTCDPAGTVSTAEWLWNETDRINPTVPSAPSVNLLTGTLTDKTIVSYSVLTLGREKTSRNVGFWMYTSTNIPAHRAYIELDTNIAGGISLPAYAKGYTLNFGNIINTQRR